MIIKVEISEETWARMLTGKRVEGTIGLNLRTRQKTFKAYSRTSHTRKKDELVRKLPWGWLKRSDKKWKTFISVDNDLPLLEVLQNFDSDHKEAMAAIVDECIIDEA